MSFLADAATRREAAETQRKRIENDRHEDLKLLMDDARQFYEGKPGGPMLVDFTQGSKTKIQLKLNGNAATIEALGEDSYCVECSPSERKERTKGTVSKQGLGDALLGLFGG
jgi:hypothetical protein